MIRPNEIFESYDKLRKIAENLPKMPNVKSPVMNKGICWETKKNTGKYSLQENKITGHCRIVETEKGQSNRGAWGGKSAMEELFDKMTRR